MCLYIDSQGFLSVYLQYNFVGRILGPRGLTAKQLEAETGCKIMVRGKSSMRDKKKVRSSVAVCLVYTRGKLIFFNFHTILRKFLGQWSHKKLPSGLEET